MERFRKGKKSSSFSSQKPTSKQRRSKPSKLAKNNSKGQKSQDVGLIDGTPYQTSSPTIVPVEPNKWGLVRVYLGDLNPETVYKTVLVTPETTTNEVLKSVVETVNGLPINTTVTDYCLQEAQDGPQGSYYRVLGALEYPLVVQNKWDDSGGWSFKLSWRSKQIEDRMKTPLSSRRALSPTPVSIHMDHGSGEIVTDCALSSSSRGRSSSHAIMHRHLVRSGCGDVDDDETSTGGGSERNSIGRSFIDRIFHPAAGEGKQPTPSSLAALTPEQWQRYLEIAHSISSPERQVPSRRDSSLTEEPCDLECSLEESSHIKHYGDSPMHYHDNLKSHIVVPKNSPVHQGRRNSAEGKTPHQKSITMPHVARRQKCTNIAKRRLVKSSHMSSDFAISSKDSTEQKQPTSSQTPLEKHQESLKQNKDADSKQINAPTSTSSSKLTHSSSCPSFQEKWQVLDAEIAVALETGISGIMNRVINEMSKPPTPIKVRRWHSMKTGDTALVIKHITPGRFPPLLSTSSETEEEIIIEPNIQVKRVPVIDHSVAKNTASSTVGDKVEGSSTEGVVDEDSDPPLDDSIFSPLQSEGSKMADLVSTDEGISSPSPQFSSISSSASCRESHTGNDAAGVDAKQDITEYEEETVCISFKDGFSSTDVSAASSRLGYHNSQQEEQLKDDTATEEGTATTTTTMEGLTTESVGGMNVGTSLPVSESGEITPQIPIVVDEERIAQVWTTLGEDGHQMKGKLPILMELTVMPSKAPGYLNVKAPSRPPSDIFQRPLSKVLTEASNYLDDGSGSPHPRNEGCSNVENSATIESVNTENRCARSESPTHTLSPSTCTTPPPDTHTSSPISHTHSPGTHSTSSSPTGCINTNVSNNCDSPCIHGSPDTPSHLGPDMTSHLSSEHDGDGCRCDETEDEDLVHKREESLFVYADTVGACVDVDAVVLPPADRNEAKEVTESHFLNERLGGGKQGCGGEEEASLENDQRSPLAQRHTTYPGRLAEGEYSEEIHSNQASEDGGNDGSGLQPKMEQVRFSSPLPNQKQVPISKREIDVDSDPLLWEGSDYGFIDDEDELLPPLPVTPNSPPTSSVTPNATKTLENPESRIPLAMNEPMRERECYRGSEEREDFLDELSSQTSADSGDDVSLNNYNIDDDDSDWSDCPLEEILDSQEDFTYAHEGQMIPAKIIMDLSGDFGRGKSLFSLLSVIDEDSAEEEEEREYLAYQEEKWRREVEDGEELVSSGVDERHQVDFVVTDTDNGGVVKMADCSQNRTEVECSPSKLDERSSFPLVTTPTSPGALSPSPQTHRRPVTTPPPSPVTNTPLSHSHKPTPSAPAASQLKNSSHDQSVNSNVIKSVCSSSSQTTSVQSSHKIATHPDILQASLPAKHVVGYEPSHSGTASNVKMSPPQQSEPEGKSPSVKPRDRALKNVSIANIKKQLMKGLPTSDEEGAKQPQTHKTNLKPTSNASTSAVSSSTNTGTASLPHRETANSNSLVSTTRTSAAGTSVASSYTSSGRTLANAVHNSESVGTPPTRKSAPSKKERAGETSRFELTIKVSGQSDGNSTGKSLKSEVVPPPLSPLFKSRGSSPTTSTCSEKSLTPPLGEHFYRKSPDPSLRISNLFSGTRRTSSSSKVKTLSMKFDKAMK